MPFDLNRIKTITKTFPTPFYIYSEKEIIDRVKALQEAFSWNKGFKEYFAVKATPNPAILKILKGLGCGIDCASMAELIMGHKLGIEGNNIMFTSNDTPVQEYRLAIDLGAIINIDDINHIDTLIKIGLPDKICLRYNPGTDFIVQNDIMGELKESKFGMTKKQIMMAVRTLSGLGVKQFGLHAMLASCALDENYYPTLAQEMFSLALEVKQQTGVTVSFIDLSGGIGIPYRPMEREPDIAKIGERVKKVYDKLIEANDMSVDIYSELGRYITGPCGYLVSTVIHKKQTYKNYIGIDATACNLMRPAMYGAYHYITVLGKNSYDRGYKYDVVGSLCENNDKFAVDRMLPSPNVGDIVVIHDVGAHGYSMGYNYNGKLKCAELLLERGGNIRLIRRAQTLDDYFATLDIYPEFRPRR